MTWNRRVMKDADGIMSVREVYYHPNKEIECWTGPVEPVGIPHNLGGDSEALYELGQELASFRAALCFPVLDEEKLLEMMAAKTPKAKTKKEKLKKK